MKLFMAALLTETNTFSPIPTGHGGFHDPSYRRNNAGLEAPAWGNIPLIAWRRLAAEHGIAVIESITANAQPSGTTIGAVYEELRDLILADLAAAGPVGMVLLNLHGAMVAEGYDDCESDLVARARAIVGPDTIIGVELDLHCHLDERLRTNADIVITYKEYPHTDMSERAEEVFSLALAAAQGKIRPVMAYRRLRMINMWHTPIEPMKSLIAEMQAEEKSGRILSLSFAHGFPWGDVPHVGAVMLAIADGDATHAQDTADRWASRIWDLRETTRKRFDTPDQAIDIALAGPGLTIIAETSDNAGGGAPSDCTAMLAAMLRRSVTNAAIGVFWDPVAVSFCAEAGEGARFPLRLGGKCGVMSGAPLDLIVRVHRVAQSHVQTALSGGVRELGPAAWVEAEGIHIIIGSQRNQVFNPDAFTGLGCMLADRQMVVVKSSQHFYAAFAPIADRVRYCAAEAGILRDFAAIPYQRFTEPYWPKVEDPFA